MRYSLRFRRSLFLVVVAAVLGCSARGAEWTALLDRELSHWERYLSFRHQDGYKGAEPVDAAGKKIAPLGYNHDPAGVFTVVEQDGELVLHVSGEYYGCVFTKQDFANYRFKLKVKWGEKKWVPRLTLLRDTGIIYHSSGPAGVDWWRAWMLGQEFQIMEGHMGDYWNIANSAIDVRAFLPEGAMNAIASSTQPFLPFGTAPSIAGFCLRSENHESPPGEWTEIELICFEDKSLHLVNGKVVMVLRNSRSVRGGVATPMTKGKLQLQSEAGEAYFKDIAIAPIDALPAEYAKLFD